MQRKWVGVALFALANAGLAKADFINWENPHVHPLDITPDGDTLLAVNTPDGRLEVFQFALGVLIHSASIPVGLDPVSVRARSNTQAWVVNHISDSVSVVDLATGNVVATLNTADEPADIVFAGNPLRAFVSCSQANRVLIFDPANLQVPPQVISIEGEDPRAMAVSADGQKVYVAIFESGNRSTVLGGGSELDGGFPPNVVNDPLGPYGGVNPPPNNGPAFSPPINPALPEAPAVGLIVKKSDGGQWLDDNGGDWTALVSGASAARSGRPAGWDLVDHDLAIIDAFSLSVSYASGAMNICMALAVNPATGEITVVGTDATNEIRFEPNVNGRFLRVRLGFVDAATSVTTAVVDLNPHLTYSVPTISQVDRNRSIGDPRGIAWSASGATAYVTGMGSNNVIVIDAFGNRTGMPSTIDVGEGPTGIVLDESRGQAYVLNKFASSISVVDTLSMVQTQQVPMFDPSPSAIKIGRRHLYDTHKNSGLGHIACASCHVDARMDRLAWDLGDPAGAMRPFNQNCAPLNSCEPWHPMKGPMTTQTLQDIIGKEPHHWRGDRNGIEEFNGAFQSLLGDDTNLTPAEMQEFESFLATVAFPPNPFRDFDNQLPTNLPLAGHFTTGRFAPAGQPLPPGNAVRGLNLYRTALLDGVDCVTCHTLPTGIGSNYFFQPNPPSFQPFPIGPNGEFHHQIVSMDGSTNTSIKTPQLRNLHEKVGFETTQLRNVAGFGFLHDGSVDSIARFVTEPVFAVESDQEVADLVALMLSFSGSDLPMGNLNDPGELPGPSSKDAHAAVGKQTTVTNGAAVPSGQLNLINDMKELAQADRVGLVVKGRVNGERRGFEYAEASPGVFRFQSDRSSETLTEAELLLLAVPGGELTYTVVPTGTQHRIGVDRDRDGFLDGDELDGCSDPGDPASVPPQCAICGSHSAPVDVDLEPRTRFLTFRPFDPSSPPAPGEQRAIRVRLVSLHHVSPPYSGGASVPFTSFEGEARWVGPPDIYLEDSASGEPFYAARLQCTPYYHDWSTIDVLHVTGSAIVPSSSYEVQTVSENCQTGLEVNYSAALALSTTRWGDLESPHNPPSPTVQPDITDVSALVNKFRALAGAPIKARALQAGEPGDIHGEITPVVLGVDFGFSHISVCVDAYRGQPYPYTIASCP